MVCSECKVKDHCYYDKLEEWEESCFYVPCYHMSVKHDKIIQEHIKKALDSYGEEPCYDI